MIMMLQIARNLCILQSFVSIKRFKISGIGFRENLNLVEVWQGGAVAASFI